ncbi:MAG: hypothetical protein J7577_13315 [Sphingobacteriaceae bacterium]|nr:hypothetical protein [Sphingobacteriaceae bacterium]
MNLFDGLQAAAHSIVNTTFGYVASWMPSSNSGGILQLANILFKDATETAKILDVPYSPKNCMMEYKQGDFLDLKPAVDSNSEEIVTINGLEYGVMRVTSKYDGKTYYAELQQL